MSGIYYQNIFQKKTKILLNEEKEIALGSTKDTYRGRDYRLSVILIYARLLGKLPKEIEELLYTLKEICRLAYMESYKRCPKYVLRLYNVCYIHLIRCVDVFGKSPKIHKIYGSYFHAITVHLPEQCWEQLGVKASLGIFRVIPRELNFFVGFTRGKCF